MGNPDAPYAGRPRIGRWPVRVDRLVYTTITLMAVLVIYDGWDELTITGVIAVIVGPVTAICPTSSPRRWPIVSTPDSR